MARNGCGLLYGWLQTQFPFHKYLEKYYLTHSMVQSSRQEGIVKLVKKFSVFYSILTEGLLSCPQRPTTGRYPQPE
jgi:hypothetical protein